MMIAVILRTFCVPFVVIRNDTLKICTGGEALSDDLRIQCCHLLEWTENKSPLKTESFFFFFFAFYLANNCLWTLQRQASAAPTRQQHVITLEHNDAPPRRLCVHVLSLSDHTLVPPSAAPAGRRGSWKPATIAHALVWQRLALSYFSKCAWSFQFGAGLSLRYNVQTCPEATTTKTDKQTNKQKPHHDFSYTVFTMLQCWE